MNKRTVPIIAILLSVVCMGATCGPKKVCNAVEDWNYKSGEMLVEIWETWDDFYTEEYIVVIEELLEDYAPKLTEQDILELIAAVETGTEPESQTAKDMYLDYKLRMSSYDKASKALEKTLDYTSEAMEIVEHAMISCDGFTDKNLRKAITELSRGLLEIVDILEEAGVDVPDMVLQAKKTADDILAEIEAGNGF